MARTLPNLTDAVRGLAATLVAAGRTRLELFGLELAEQKALAGRLLCLVAIAAVAAGMALLVLTGWFIALFWETPYRLLAFGLVGVFWLLMAVLTAWLAWRAIQQAPAPFEMTLNELARDAHALAGTAAGPGASRAWPADPAAPVPPSQQESP